MRGTWWIGSVLVLMMVFGGGASATASVEPPTTTSGEPEAPAEVAADHPEAPDEVSNETEPVLAAVSERIVTHLTEPASEPSSVFSGENETEDEQEAGSAPPEGSGDGGGSSDEREGAAEKTQRIVLRTHERVADIVEMVPDLEVPEILPVVEPVWTDGQTEDGGTTEDPAVVAVQAAPAPLTTAATPRAPSELVAIAVTASAAAMAAASAATLAGKGSVLWRPLDWLRKAVGIGLYARLAKDKVLDHEKRQLILDQVRANPGACVTELQATVQMSINAVTHHLRVLESNGLVKSIKSGRRRCFFATGDNLSPQDRIAAATLSSEATRRVYSVIELKPGIRQQELAEALAITPTSVMFHTRRLEDAGVVERARSGRALAYYPSGARVA